MSIPDDTTPALPTKRCTKCGEERPHAEFNRDRRHLSGLKSECKSCETAYRKQNLERIAARNAAYHVANREKKLAYVAAYYEQNRERLLTYAADYRAANRERLAAQARGYRRSNAAQVMYQEWRGSGCLVCGIVDVRVVQAHHVDPTEKDAAVCMIRDTDRMAAELEKCIPLCANHHLIVHTELHNGWKDAPLEALLAYLKEQQ